MSRKSSTESTRARVWGGAWVLVALARCANVHRPPSADLDRYEGPITSRDISRGGEIFGGFCNSCHAGRVNPRGYHWTPAQMRRQIREGNAAMPGISDDYLSARDLESVLAFLTMIGAVEATLPPAPEGTPTSLTPSPSP